MLNGPLKKNFLGALLDPYEKCFISLPFSLNFDRLEETLNEDLLFVEE